MESEAANGLDYLGEMILAAGALGIAAFGIVDGFKWTRFGTAGFGIILKLIQPAAGALSLAFGDGWQNVLREQYRDGRGRGACRSSIRQGIRIGLTPDNAADVATISPVVASGDLLGAVTRLRDGDDLSEADQAAMGRFELGLDARLDAAFSKAEAVYISVARNAAGAIALGVALVAAGVIGVETDPNIWLRAVIVGLVAVPLAPIAKDVANALTSAGRALGRR